MVTYQQNGDPRGVKASVTRNTPVVCSFIVIFCWVVFSLAEIQVDLMGVQEVADPPRRGDDAVHPHLLHWVDLTALVLAA